MTTQPIKTALISVSEKEGIAEFAQALHELGIMIISTGGTADLLKQQGIPATEVSDLTNAPEMMEGRVKTLHPIIHGGILAKRDSKSHQGDLKKHSITPIDLVVVNLYPFEKTLAQKDSNQNANHSDLIENIDVGGVTLIRAAAKNHDSVTILTDHNDYKNILSEIKKTKGVSNETRLALAEKAFAHTAQYDSNIASYFQSKNSTASLPKNLTLSGEQIATLRYGENPHQDAALYRLTNAPPRIGTLSANQIQGKPLSYNNINDANAAIELVAEFSKPTIAIIKHANPCGVASHNDLADAWQRALKADPVSAFGGIIAMNKPLTAGLAKEIISIFTEVIIAPEADSEALKLIASKPDLRLLITGAMPDPSLSALEFKSVAGGFLAQSRDNTTASEASLTCVTKTKPTKEQIRDMLFAIKVAKHVKSNAIVYAKDEATLGIGAGQMSRLDSSRIAISKAKDIEVSLEGSVVASDAFFPFADGLLAATEAGAKAVIQPGGSIRDDEVIAAADEANIAMVFTNLRHFKH